MTRRTPRTIAAMTAFACLVACSSQLPDPVEPTLETTQREVVEAWEDATAVFARK